MATYGAIPGVRVNTSTGNVAGVTIGREQYLTLIGIGNDPDNDSELNSADFPASNEVVPIAGRDDVVTKFGDGSDFDEHYNRALANGANPNYINAIRASTTSATTSETEFSGTLANTPIVPDDDRFTVTDDSSTELEHEFRYEDPLSPPGNEDVFYVNPQTGDYDITVSSTTSVDIDYEYADWQSAISAASGAIDEGQFGVITPLVASDSAVTQLQSVVSSMRSDYKMALGFVPAQPNATKNGGPWIDAQNFTQSYADDTLWMAGPNALEELDSNPASGLGALGAVAGLYAGNPTTEPVYNTALSGIAGLHQDITRTDVTDLRSSYVVPIRDTGTIRVKDNHSTYEQDVDGGWERDFFRRRIVDLTTVTLFQVSRRQIGGVLDDELVDDLEDVLIAQMNELVEDGLLEPGGQNIEVYRKDDRTVGIDAQITPYGVAKAADVGLEVIA